MNRLTVTRMHSGISGKDQDIQYRTWTKMIAICWMMRLIGQMTAKLYNGLNGHTTEITISKLPWRRR
jgi:hypothetical protein